MNVYLFKLSDWTDDALGMAELLIWAKNEDEARRKARRIAGRRTRTVKDWVTKKIRKVPEGKVDLNTCRLYVLDYYINHGSNY